MFTHVINLPEPNEAMEKLEEACTAFLNLLDYVAENHPQMLDADFSMSVEQAINHTWIKYDLPQS
jgi:hypothetical protein